VSVCRIVNEKTGETQTKKKPWSMLSWKDHPKNSALGKTG